MFVTEVGNIIFCCFPIRENKCIGRNSVLRYFIFVIFSSYLWGREEYLLLRHPHVWDTQDIQEWINWKKGDKTPRVDELCSTCFSLPTLWEIPLERKHTKVMLPSNIPSWPSGRLKNSGWKWDWSVDLAFSTWRGRLSCCVAEACSGTDVFLGIWMEIGCGFIY